MRYWKGAYDEDSSRDRELHHIRGLADDEEDRDIRFFQVLVVIQFVLFTLAGLLFVSWR